MDVSRIHPLQVRALLDGHACGLFRDYRGNIKPLKLCLGLPRLLPGELTPKEPAAEVYDSNEADTGIYLGTCFPQKGFGFMEGVGLGLVGVGGEKLEVDREVGRWMGEVVRRIPEVAYPVEVLPVNLPGGGREEVFKEEVPLLRRPRGEEWAGEGEYVPKLPEAGVTSERLGKMKVPFRRSKEEKEADGGDGGMRWSRRVKKEIGEWVIGAAAGEKMLGERAVVEWIREVITRDVGFGEGGLETPEPVLLTNGEIEEDEVLFPLELGRKEGKTLDEAAWVRIEWPPKKEVMRGLMSIGSGGVDELEVDLLGEFRGGYVTENLAENNEALGENINTPKATSLHIPSSPPTYHLIALGPASSPTSLSPPNKKRPRNGQEDLYIEGPLTPLPSSPFPFHHDNPKSAKKPRPQLKIDLPPPDPIPPSQKIESEEEKAFPTPIIAEGKFFLASLAQEQLSADDGLLRETVPIMDVYPGELRLAAPWDGIDVLLSSRDSDGDIDVMGSWLGLAARWWHGDRIIGLELAWKPFTRSAWGVDILKERIGGSDGDGEGEELLQEVEKGVEVGRKAEAGLILGDWEQGVGEDEEEELEPILGLKKIQLEDILEKRKRDGEFREGEDNREVQGNITSNEYRQPQIQNSKSNNGIAEQSSVELPQPSLNRRRRLAAILHDVTSDRPWKRPSMSSKRLSPVKALAISKAPLGFAPILNSLTTSFSATASLATFMSMRGRASVDPVPSRLHSPTPLSQPTPVPPLQQLKTLVDVPKLIVPAPILPPNLPKAQFIVSTTLLQSYRGVIRAVKALWGNKADWVEREYVQAGLQSQPHLSTLFRLSAGSGGNEVPISEEDYEQPPLLISPTAGLFLTSLARIRQRVLLPGEKQIPGNSTGGIKDSILRIARTVERLWVVVIATGGVTSEKDTEHWCLFLAFCAGVGLEGCNVKPLLVSVPAGGEGADEVVARWAGGVMFREAMYWKDIVRRFAPWWAEDDHEADASDFHQTEPVCEEEEETTADGDAWVTRTETTGEMFLRKAGMNVFAAGVVLREVTRLEDEDLQGGVGAMRRLLVMGREERLRLFGRLVGARAVEGLSAGIEGGLEWRRMG
ncbi:hypothetical protein EV426DRAFT_710181 [Tirmania nivea]|nr:hypothetical protein EV426DRAFT_710181 [Tirmania nivea]